MITATFSDGTTDIYRGSRQVTAAWRVIFPDGRTASGHSLDEARATKTASSAISARGGADIRGCRGNPRKIAEARKAAQEFAAACKVEIIRL